jgi:DNA repair protein RecO (recombination protein O)
MGLYRDEAVVLRTQKLGEADRIVTLLTRRHGLLRAVAKGVRRTTSRFGARLEPFTHVDLQLYEGRSLEVISQAETLASFGKGIVAEFPRYTVASAVVETAERLTEERQPALRLYLLTLGALRSLAAGAHAPSLTLDAFLLRAMEIAGWAPTLTECVECGRSGGHVWFSVPLGGAVCLGCRPSGCVSLSPAVAELMRALTEGEWGPAEASDAVTRRHTSGLVAAHLQWHLEHRVRSLAFVDRTASGSVSERAPSRPEEPYAVCAEK